MANVNEVSRVPVSTNVSRDKLSSIDERFAKSIWVGCLLAEYRILQLAKYGIKPVEVGVKAVEQSRGERGSDIDVDALYQAIFNVKERGEREGEYEFTDVVGVEERIVKDIEKAVTYKDPDYLVRAADELNKVLGDNDKYIRITSYAPVVTILDINEENAERVRRLADKVLRIMAPLGGRLEAELMKLIFSGYKRGITDTIEGLGSEEKKFLEQLLDKPFERAALIFAYGKVADIKNLIYKMIKVAFNKDIVKPSFMVYKLPVLKTVNY